MGPFFFEAAAAAAAAASPTPTPTPTEPGACLFFCSKSFDMGERGGEPMAERKDADEEEKEEEGGDTGVSVAKLRRNIRLGTLEEWALG